MIFLKSKKLEFDLLRIIPSLTPSKIKGENGIFALKTPYFSLLKGKFAIIGGSFEYTGAPYYVGISSLRAVKKPKKPIKTLKFSKRGLIYLIFSVLEKPESL